MLLELALFTLWPLAVYLSKRPLPMGKVMVFAILTVLVYGIVPSGAQLTLDKASNTAILSRYFFYHWETERIARSSINNASLRTGSTSTQISLQLTDGSYRLLSELNQAGGKEQAVHDINRFLGRD